jgi:ketosteroid isomerase-like protein
MSARRVVEGIIKAWSTQDVETALSYASDDFVYALHVSEEMVPFAGTSEGKEAVCDTLHTMLEIFDYLKFDQNVIGVSGEIVRVQTQFKLHHRRTGENPEGSIRTIFTVRNGLAIRCDEYLDQHLIETFMRLVRQREAQNDTVEPPQITSRSKPLEDEAVAVCDGECGKP